MQNFLPRLLKWLGLAAAALVVVVARLCRLLARHPDARPAQRARRCRTTQPPITTRVYAGNGTVLGEYAHERRIFVPAAFIPKLVKEAFTSAEDRNFYNHPGIDPSGILRAAIKDVGLVLEGRRPQGASTITQQVARGFLLNSDLKMARKVREAILAIRIDATYPKEKVLELYLNEINLGQNSYGVAAAALNYFGKSLDELDIAEVAFLAALPKSPSHYDPRFHHEAALDRRNWVIDQMADNGYITDAQAARRQGRAAGDPDPRPGQPGRRRGLLCRGSAPAALQAVWRQGAVRRRLAGARLAGHAAAELCRQRLAHRAGAL